MNEELTKKLTALADRLGTTIEHLWGVLVRQAPIDSATHLVVWALAIISTVLIYRKSNAALAEDGDSCPGYFGMLVAVVMSVVILAEVCFSASNVAAGFFNPEYWALVKLLNR